MPSGSTADVDRSLVVEPPGAQWSAEVGSARDQHLLERPLSTWRAEARRQLALPADRPIVATGHQTLLWHPGILAKYLATQAAVRRDPGLAAANLIVDQHASGFGTFEAPVRAADGALAVRRIRLAEERRDVPMGLHAPVTPVVPAGGRDFALPAVAAGVERIVAAVTRHRDRPNAALQMGAALSDLMSRWVEPMPAVTATDLLATGLGRGLLEAMADDPRRCAAHYNAAVAAEPDADIAPLRVGREFVELPVWRTRGDGRRVRAYDVDLQRWLEKPAAFAVLPRALLLTALVRLALADLFVHGTGGGRYDRAMERWIRGWLDVDVAPKAVVSATLTLPLETGPPAPRRDTARARLRGAWHDPERVGGSASAAPRPGRAKREHLAAIASAPFGSAERRARYFAMHADLERLRRDRAQDLEALRADLDRAVRAEREWPIAARRTWPFPLYPDAMIDELDARVRARFDGQST